MDKNYLQFTSKFDFAFHRRVFSSLKPTSPETKAAVSRCSSQLYKGYRKAPGLGSYWEPVILLKQGLLHKYLPVNSGKSLRKHFLQNISGRLLLSIQRLVTD